MQDLFYIKLYTNNKSHVSKKKKKKKKKKKIN